MNTLTLDGRPVTVPAGATILDAARLLGIAIPTLCHVEGLPPGTSCMVCVVEVEHLPRLVPACAYPARPGLVVRTDTPAVLAARRAAVELLMGEHVGDCEGPCRRGCPAGLDIPRMLRQIAAGQTAEALATVRRSIALPAVLGRICPAPCEKVCRRAKIDQPVSICLLKRFVADEGAAVEEAAAADSGFRVAIVGAGPAGLSAAFYLRRLGHACAVYDEQPEPGGALRSAVPEARLPRAVLEREIGTVRRLGAVFHPGVRIGRDVSLAELRASHDAVILAVGAADAAQAAALGAPASPHGLQADEQTLASPLPGVFVAGGALRPLQLAVRACAAGKTAARSCDQYLKKEQPALGPKRFNSVAGKLSEGELAELRGQASDAGRLEPAAGAGFSPAEAAAEAARCLHCDCRKAGDCRLREAVERLARDPRRYAAGDRPALELQREPGGVVFEPGKCIKCGRCVRLSRLHADVPGLDFIRRGFRMRVSPPVGESVASALAGLAGEAIAGCPTGALAWDRAEDATRERES